MSLKFISSENIPTAGITTVYECGDNFIVSAEDYTLTPEDNRFTVMVWSKSDIDLLEGNKWDWDKGHDHAYSHAWYYDNESDRDAKLNELQTM